MFKMCRIATLLLLPGLPSFGQVDHTKVVTVGPNGKAAYQTVQAAVDSTLPSGYAEIRIAPGTYREKIHVTAPNLHLVGTGHRPEDTVLIFSDTHTSAGGTGASASLTVTADNFRAENLTIANDWEKTHARADEGSQAVALLVSGDRAIFERVRLLGYQDTLYANSKSCHGGPTDIPCRASRQYFHDCYIEGHVDFIFGDAKAVLDHCEIHALDFPTVMLTAQSRTFPLEDSGYWFLNCRVTAAPTTAPRRIILGRPWRAYSTVYWVNTDFSALIEPAGWDEWDGRLKTATYGEFGSKGVDATGRWTGVTPVTAEQTRQWTPNQLLAGEDHWQPAR